MTYKSTFMTTKAWVTRAPPGADGTAEPSARLAHALVTERMQSTH